MDRREFISLSAMGFFSMAFADKLAFAESLSGVKHNPDGSYSIVILGDTHFDTDPDTVYHANYVEPDPVRDKVHRAEFVRNAEMWKKRCPKILSRASSLVDKDTRYVFQMGDLIQGDCGSGEVHQKMLSDVMDHFKTELGGVPFVTVVGNHDIRGVDAEKVYHEFMPKRMSEEIGKKIEKTTFGFMIGKDAFIFIDFNSPDDAEIEKILEETKDARHTFVVTHGPVFPSDDASCRWILYGWRKNTKQRRHFRELFAKRNAIVLCGHTHTTEMMDWVGDGGRITQMTMSSVWGKNKKGKWVVDYKGADQYGAKRAKIKTDSHGKPLTDETALYDEYRPGIRSYVHSSVSCGCYKLNVSENRITVDFYAGGSKLKSHKFVLR